MTLIGPEIRELITATESFYARLLRIDRSWRERDVTAPSAIDRLRQRYGHAVAQ